MMQKISPEESEKLDSRVEDAIIIAAGLGTRMLPASLYYPKEMLPLVDSPGIHHLIREARKAGARRIHLVVSEEKISAFREIGLKGRQKISDGIRTDLPNHQLDPVTEDMELKIHIQKSPRGVGDAILCALGDIHGSFIVIMGDNILLPRKGSFALSKSFDGSEASLELVNRYKITGKPVAGVFAVNVSEIHNYGIVNTSNGMVERITEKPNSDEVQSNLALCGRFVFPQGVKEILEMTEISEMGELQSIGLLNYLIENVGLEVHEFEEYSFLDSGEPVSWLKAQIEHAIFREDLRNEIIPWIEEVLVSVKGGLDELGGNSEPFGNN